MGLIPWDGTLVMSYPLQGQVLCEQSHGWQEGTPGLGCYFDHCLTLLCEFGSLFLLHQAGLPLCGNGLGGCIGIAH